MVTQAEIAQNLIPNEPGLKDLLDRYKRNTMLALNCHHIATIQTFNSATQTASATVNYKKTFIKPHPITGVYQSELRDYPVMLDCPVVFLGGLTSPVITGDECLALFNDRDIDNWLNGSSNSAVATARLHSFSDAILLVGIRSLANVIPDFNTAAPELRNRSGTSRVAVGETGVTVDFNGNQINLTNDGCEISLTSGVTLNITAEGKLVIDNLTEQFVPSLVTLFQTIASATAGGFPLVMPTFVADLAALQTFQE